MKKLIYVCAIALSAIIVGCNPLEDIHEDVNKNSSLEISGDVVYTLEDDDYEDLDLNFGNFSSNDDAKDLLPDFLSDKYPALGKGSSALITYKLYNRVDTYEADVYELSDEEHNAITGKTFGNFDRSNHIYDYLEATYPDAEDGDFVSLRYRFYNGSESTLTDGFAFENGEWIKFTGFTEDQYQAMGEGFPNFSSEDEANVKIPIALVDVYKFDPKSAGDIVLAMYELYQGGGVTRSFTAAYVYNGSEFLPYENELDVTLQFGHDGTTWVPDNTIKYTLEASDYPLIVEALSDKYPAATGSMDNYGNFERRPGNAAEWTPAMIAEAMDVVLSKLNPDAEEGQKYVVTYDIYNGSSGTEDIAVIKTDGVWVLQ
ncbi:hypothetical protein FUA26_05160 [Seonamhaeicola algicola]|uniref:DUF5017 domain-containing protein n=1 Tax=Seonamhaeicola algicola TaxID=1719036 RepID=A0A5C7B3Q0_9FLAO|nr:hypothetical protein [Seonamhaeicola algicola]TXE13185.1 hypothetical protein FUA26_05160 [Seonamhaeicola algicola]